ncbi:MAG: hypothetical protein Kow0068_09240 [Marinilabiliales bacterium]
MAKFIYILILIISAINLNAQDIHYSQFDATPLNINPALSGYFDGDYRIIGNHRTQWLSITENPYRTNSLSFDMKIKKNFSFNNLWFGAGVLLNTDKAGDGNFGTNQIKLSPAVHKIITQDSSLTVSLGFNIAFNQNSLDYNAFYFGNQWDGNKFNNQLPNNEFFSKDQFSYFDFSFGTIVKYIYHSLPVTIGLSLNHINQPEKSFFDNQISELKTKFTGFAQCNYQINSQSSILPSIIYFDQGKYYEFDIGLLFKQQMNDINFKSVYFGGWVRTRDAAILKFAFDYKDFLIGISYDINLSKLRIASEGRGGIELSCIYILNKPKKFYPTIRQQCPVFM